MILTERDTTGLVMLFGAMVRNAIGEAVNGELGISGNVHRARRDRAKPIGRSWFFSSEFLWWCFVFGASPQVIREHSLEQIDTGKTVTYHWTGTEGGDEL